MLVIRWMFLYLMYVNVMFLCLSAHRELKVTEWKIGQNAVGKIVTVNIFFELT